MVYESHVRFVKSFFIIGNQHLILILLRCYNWDYVKNCFYASQLTWERFISISMFDWINIEWTMNVLPRNRRMFWHGWYMLQSTLSNINQTGQFCWYMRGWISWVGIMVRVRVLNKWRHMQIWFQLMLIKTFIIINQLVTQRNRYSFMKKSVNILLSRLIHIRLNTSQ